MNILVIGSGGREHSLVCKLKQSSSVEKIYSFSGNGGINMDAVRADICDDFDSIADFCKLNDVGLVVVGAENPLVDGITDHLERYGIRVFGPSAEAAQVEGSKQFMKDLVVKYGIPTAKYETFTDPESAKVYIKNRSVPIVIKTDGLAAGKGVIIPETTEEAFSAVDEMFAGRFGAAGEKIIIEDFLEGEEVSFFAICDGKTAIPFCSAQDHKKVGEGDTGPNTGGMGAYSPAPIVTQELHDRIMSDMILPFVNGMSRDGISYKGVLFAGLMIDKKGNPNLLEYNIRFGDPECQVLMSRLKSDLLPILLASCDGNLGEIEAEFYDKASVCVVMAANGYPRAYQKGTEIHLDNAEKIENVTIFHAGTKYADGKLTANGGRVLGITATCDNITEAKVTAYKAVDAVEWCDGFCRRDIGWRVP